MKSSKIEEKDGETVLKNLQGSKESPREAREWETLREEQTQGLYGTAMEQPWNQEEDHDMESHREKGSSKDKETEEIQTQKKIGLKQED